MKNLLIILIVLIAATGCGEKNNINDLVDIQQSAKLEDNNVENKIEYPLWLTNLYPDSVVIDYPEDIQYQSIIKFLELNDSVSYCIYETIDGICSNQFLATQVNKEELDNILIESNCDHDLSIPVYLWREHQMLDSVTIKTTEHVEFVPTEFLNKNGDFKEGKAYDDYEHKVDSSYSLFKILETGKINNFQQ